MKPKKMFAWIMALAVMISMLGNTSSALASQDVNAQSETILESVSFAASSSSSAEKLVLTQKESGETGFEADVTDYVISTPDTATNLYVWAAAEDGASVKVTYKKTTDDSENFVSVTSGSSSGKNLPYVQLAGSKENRDLSMEVTKAGKTKTYHFTTKIVSRTLNSLSASCQGKNLKIAPNFNAGVREYTATVLDTVDTIKLSATPYKSQYQLSIDGVEMTDSSMVVNMGTESKKEIDVKVQFEGDDDTVSNHYKLTVNRVSAVNANFDVTPEDAFVFVTDDQGEKVIPNAQGAYQLIPGNTYDYTITKKGYVGQKGQLVLEEDTTTPVELKEAAENTAIDKNISAYWKNFRNDENNMAVVDVKTPQSTLKTELKWAKKLGSGWSESPCVQIIVDDKVITIVGKKIYKLDPETGDIIQSGDLVGATNWGYTPPTYADGIIFCPLAGGTVQAINAKTLESLWVYKDKLGGQSLSAITYKDGYVYTGFWNSETKDANFVCLSATDENPENTTEEKVPTWTYKQKGGFYWAGSIAIGDAIIVGTDDGDSGNVGTSHLLSLNRKTGTVISDLTLKGDQRSCIAFDTESQRIFGTTKAGYLFSAAVDQSTGELSDLKTKWYGQEGDSETATMSTSTPVVYKGVAYIGYTASGNFGGKGYSLLAADANTLEEKYRVPLIGYPQGSALLSTAYEKEDGNIYIYMTYNNMPGGITLIKAKPDAASAKDVAVEEIYDAKGYEQYCITSLICDAKGTIYYKNDSGNIFAVAKNDAFLDNIEVTGGNPVFNEAFRGNITDYEVTVDPGTTSVTISVTKQDDQTVTVNGEALTGNSKEIRLNNGTASVEIKTVCGEDERTYSLALRERNQDMDLKNLVVNESNSYKDFLALTPEFDASVDHYVAAGLSGSRTFTNIWPDSNDKNATVKVYAVSGVDKNRSGIDPDTGEISVTASNSSHNRYAVYWDDTENKAAVVRVEVTAEDQKTIKNYYLLLTAETTVNLYETEGYYKYDKEQMEKIRSDFNTYIECMDISAADLILKIREYNTQTDAVKAFQDEKAETFANLTPADDVYREAQRAEVEIILKDVKRQLQTISSEEDLETVVNKAKLDISRIKTDAELTAEENKLTLEISKKTVTLINDQTYQLTAKTTSDNPELKCVWSSSDESVATVDETGKITAVSGGVAVISVNYGGLEEVCIIHVKQEATPESIVVTPEEGKICDGFTGIQSDATHFYMADPENETSIQFKATDSNDQATTVTWKSSDSNLKISGEGLLTVPAGLTSIKYLTITATSIHSSSVKKDYIVCVIPKKLSLDTRYQDKTYTLPENGIANRQAEYLAVTPQIYDNYNLVKWTIEDTSIADIDDSENSVCYVYPKKAGTTTVTVTDIFHPENSASTTITVKGFSVTDEGGNTGEGYANAGDTVKLTAQTEDAVTWSTSDKTVATVDENGTVNTLSKGEAVITATSDNGKCSYALTVGESGKVYPNLLYTSSYSSLFTDEECTKALDTKSVYTSPSTTWTSNVHVFPVTTTNDVQLYAKQGNSNLKVSFGLVYDAEKMKAELIQDNEVTASVESGKTVNVTIQSGSNEFTIRVTSLEDEKNYTDYNFSVQRALSSTATLKSASVKPYERSINSVKKYYSAQAGRVLTEGTLFRAQEDGTATGTTGFNASYYNYRAYLYSDAKEASLTVSASDSVTGHIAYSVDNGNTWTEETGTAKTSGAAFKEDNVVKYIVKCVSDSEYSAAKAAGTDPYENAVVYTFWIERMSETFDAKTTIRSLSFDENCTECSPNYVEGASMAAALVAHDSDTVKITFTADSDVDVYKASRTDSNKLTAVSEENGKAVYELEISTPLRDQGNQITQKIVVSYTGEGNNRIDQDYTVYFFKIGTTKGVLKGMPDKIVDYMCIGSQYTSGGNTGWGIYGVFPEKIFMGAGNWSTCISLGNFGGYMTYYYDDPIRDDAKNPYGVDFTVFGNSNGGAGFSEPGSVLVSEDGKTWYNLAGSEHYDATSRWDYEVTYKNNAGLADYQDNDGNGGEVSYQNSFGNMKYPTQNCYPLFDWQNGNENQITVSGVRLYGSNGKQGDGLELGGNGALPAFGYADVHQNSSTVAGTGEDVDLLSTPVGNPYQENYNGYGDGFDLKWAVDANGNPVDVSDKEFHYIKVQTASFINGGAIGEKSTEVSAVVRTSPEKESAGITDAPKSITVDGKEIALSEGKNVYYASVENEADYAVTVTPASEDTNVYINNQRAESRQYDALPDKGIIRVILQEGTANPVIYYIYVSKAGTVSAENVMASIDSLGKVTIDNAKQIADIRAAYEALSGEEKSNVGNLDVLIEAESQIKILETEKKISEAENAKDKASAFEEAKKAYDSLTEEQKTKLADAGAFEAAYVSNKIEQIGEVSLNSGNSLNEARKAYEALSKENRGKVSNYQALVNAELTFENLTLKKNFADTDKLNKEELAKLRFATASFKLAETSYVYNGKVRTPEVKVASEGKTLKKDTDYTVTYKNNKNVGKASVTIVGKGNYSGTKTLTFNINPKSTSVKTLKKGKKQIKVTWKKAASQVSGYQIKYASDKRFTKSKTITVSGIGKTAKTIKKLSSNKQYYVKIRTYKTVDGKKYYSSWSKVKSVKTK